MERLLTQCYEVTKYSSGPWTFILFDQLWCCFGTAHYFITHSAGRGKQLDFYSPQIQAKSLVDLIIGDCYGRGRHGPGDFLFIREPY